MARLDPLLRELAKFETGVLLLQPDRQPVLEVGDRQEQIRMMLADSLRAVVSQTLLKRIEGGRVAALEVLICTPAVSNLIREGKTFQIASAMQTGRKVGMVTQTDSLYELVKKKTVAPQEAYLKAADREALVKRLEADGISIKQG
jgi:twitching motility protein PilT